MGVGRQEVGRQGGRREGGEKHGDEQKIGHKPLILLVAKMQITMLESPTLLQRVKKL